MRKKIIFAFSLLLLVTFPGQIQAKNNDKMAQLIRQMEKILSSTPLKKTKVGMRVISLKTGEEIFAYHPKLPVTPASNMKVLTSLAAMSKLGPDYCFKTKFFADSKISKGQIDGNLYIKGYGDPFLVWEEVIKMARYMQGLGLKEVKGNLVVDDTYFDAKRSGNGWKTEKTDHWYKAPLGALSVNFNTIEITAGPGEGPGSQARVWINPATDFFTINNKCKTGGKKFTPAIAYTSFNGNHTLTITGSIPQSCDPETFYRAINDPPAFSGAVFKNALELWGIKFTGQVQMGEVPAKAKLLYSHDSKPLSLILRGLNKYSNNFTAEQIIKTLGAEVKGAPGTTEKGLEVLKEVLTSLNIDTEGMEFYDGSGLAAGNRVTAQAMTQILSSIYDHFNWQPEFMTSLPIAGVDGTLRRRMKNGDAKNCVRAKTGYINEVAALSGYINTKDKEMWAFSIIVNDFNYGPCDIHIAQDKLCALMASYSEK